MKKFGCILIVLILSSCTPGIVGWPTLDVKFDKQDVSVNEKINIKVTFDEISDNAVKNLILYVEDYPEDISIVNGQLCEEKTNEKFLCVIPEKFSSTKYRFDFQISFNTPGEYIIKINAASLSENQINPWFNEDNFSFKFIVNE